MPLVILCSFLEVRLTSSHKISSHLQRNQPDFTLTAQTLNGLEIPIGLELLKLPYDIAHVEISMNKQKDLVKVEIFCVARRFSSAKALASLSFYLQSSTPRDAR